MEAGSAACITCLAMSCNARVWCCHTCMGTALQSLTVNRPGWRTAAGNQRASTHAAEGRRYYVHYITLCIPRSGHPNQEPTRGSYGEESTVLLCCWNSIVLQLWSEAAAAPALLYSALCCIVLGQVCILRLLHPRGLTCSAHVGRQLFCILR